MAALAGIQSNILLSAGRVRQVAVGCRYFNMAKLFVHRKSGRPKQVAVHPRDRPWQVLLYLHAYRKVIKNALVLDQLCAQVLHNGFAIMQHAEWLKVPIFEPH